MRPILVLVLAVALLATAGAAGADGGPSPGVDFGWNGHLDRSGKQRLVTLPTQSGTVLARSASRAAACAPTRSCPGPGAFRSSPSTGRPAG